MTDHITFKNTVLGIVEVLTYVNLFTHHHNSRVLECEYALIHICQNRNSPG